VCITVEWWHSINRSLSLTLTHSHVCAQEALVRYETARCLTIGLIALGGEELEQPTSPTPSRSTNASAALAFGAAVLRAIRVAEHESASDLWLPAAVCCVAFGEREGGVEAWFGSGGVEAEAAETVHALEAYCWLSQLWLVTQPQSARTCGVLVAGGLACCGVY